MITNFPPLEELKNDHNYNDATSRNMIKALDSDVWKINQLDMQLENRQIVSHREG